MHYLAVDVTSPSRRVHESFLGFAESRLRNLVVTLDDERTLIDIYLFPKEFQREQVVEMELDAAAAAAAVAAGSAVLVGSSAATARDAAKSEKDGGAAAGVGGGGGGGGGAAVKGDPAELAVKPEDVTVLDVRCCVARCCCCRGLHCAAHA
jgi:hypothetical protein